eukprot:gene15490-17344_t
MAVPKQGIKLSYLLDFVRENGGVSKFQNLTTLDVCTNIIKPKTLAAKLSYCEWLIVNHPVAETVKPANVFISHAWLYKFLDVINALQDHFKDSLQATIVWIDIFSVNQHITANNPPEWWNADNLKFILAQLYSGLGNYFRAGRLLHDILLKYLNEQKSPVLILELTSHLIHALGPQKKYDEMLQIFALAQSLSSKCNIPIYGIKGNIASFYIEAGKTDLAQSLLEECIEACTNNFSDANVSKNTFLTFQLNLSIIYSDKRLFQKSEELTLKIMDQCEKDIEFGKKHSIYLTCLDHLGNLYTTWKSSSNSINQVELVERYYKQAYELTKVTYGEKHPTTLTKLHNLANHYLNKGDFITAEKLFHEYLDIAVQEFGKRDTRVRVALRKLMILYKQQQREDLVTELYQKYELYHSEFEEMIHRRTNSGNNEKDNSILCLYYESQGKFDEAIVLLVEDLEEFRNKFGDNHSDTIVSAYNLACVYIKKKEFIKAKEMFQFAYNHSLSLYGQLDRKVVESLRGLGLSSLHLLLLDEAESYYSLAIEKMKKILQNNSNAVDQQLYSDLIQDVGQLYEQRKEFTKAESYYSEAIDNCDRIFGDNNTITHIAKEKLMNCYFLQNKFDLCLLLLLDCIQFYEREGKSKDLHFLELKLKLGVVHMSKHEYEDATAIFLTILPEIKAIEGDDPNVTIQCLGNLTQALIFLKRYEEAEIFLRESLNLCIVFLGEDHDNTVQIMKFIGIVLIELEKYDDYESILNDRYTACLQQFGENHVLVIQYLQQLGMVHIKQNKFYHAEIKLNKCIDYLLREFGYQHPELLNIFLKLGWVYAKLGHNIKAEKFAQTLIEPARARIEYFPPFPLELCKLYAILGKQAEAKSLYNEILGFWESKLEPTHPLIEEISQGLQELNNDR